MSRVGDEAAVTTGGAVSPGRPRLSRRVARRALPYAVPLLVSGILAWWCIGEILARAGEPAMPLDDSFIHLQYARQIAHGHLFQFTPGGGFSSGATSALWPSAIAPAFWLGLDGLSVVWFAWLLGTLAHAGTILETARLARGLAGRAGAIGAGALCAVFGAFLWFAWSGMETMALTWVLVRTARVAAETCERAAGKASTAAKRPSVTQLVLLGLAAPLVRPEGALASLMATYALHRHLGRSVVGRRRLRPGRLLALLPLAGPALLPLLNLLLVGHSASSTAMVKWLWLHPSVDFSGFVSTTLDNVGLLLENLINGGGWTAIFMPRWIGVPIAAGFVALLFHVRRRPARVAFVLLVALGTFIPTTYDTMLWNRVRYIYPFATAWFVALVCLADGVGRLGERLASPLRLVTPVAMGGFVAVFAVKLPWARADVAQSARAISLQQVSLGKWAAEALPPEAIIGVNDTGAIAYMSSRRTFDVVGLTTEGEAPYWVAGAGSRFEHYEHLPRERLPTHFFVYPGWMQLDAVLGEELTRRTVSDQSILGGATMVAYEAHWEVLDTGALPFRGPVPEGFELVDELDVADLESERRHAYQPLGARSGDDVAERLPAFDGSLVADGGRLHRPQDRFEAILPAEREVLVVMRLDCFEPVELWQDDVRIGDVPPRDDHGEANAGDGRCWDERTARLPPAKGPRRAVVVHPLDRSFASYHYWFYVEGG